MTWFLIITAVVLVLALLLYLYDDTAESFDWYLIGWFFGDLWDAVMSPWRKRQVRQYIIAHPEEFPHHPLTKQATSVTVIGEDRRS